MEARMAEIISRLGFWLGILFGVAVYLAPSFGGLSDPAQATLAITTLMVIWWVTEAIHISATALLPIILIPILGVGSIAQATAPYGNPVVFLFLGGFLLATALERSNLHKRIALGIVALLGASPNRLILGFLLSSALLSMWISNTATAMMMLPIALSVGTIGSDYGNTDKGVGALLLSVAIGSNLGGIGTLIGTPPNAIMVGYLSQNHDIQMGFGEWMLIGVPLVIVSLPIFYFILKKTMAFDAPVDEAVIAREVQAQRSLLGVWSKAEIRVTIIFTITASLWIFQAFLKPYIPGISDAGISILAGLSLFVVSDGKDSRLLDWQDAERLPWGVLILFGGGLSLAEAIQTTNLAQWIGDSMSALAVLPVPLIILIVALSIIFFSEVASNSATAAAIIPVMGALAVTLGYDPRIFVIPATLAATTAFMLPVGTPPNAIVFASGKIKQVEMIRVGFWLNLASAILITIAMMLYMM
jgi:solute carrier family 13 (sodium-dependent dicarboxylate transporter), member 2/3/5